ncbi:unnamed protein product [Fraxinus pennsylvanica]|uniref:Uncharacterized protein n=1 Tax=Fraxinus pennsylvanica TaxID=56036 RepID=A0AAD1YW32_9LAMI|nr:unnamed protein product [Fraxinus pennsylvanica]
MDLMVTSVLGMEGFLRRRHSGWNSILESVAGGIPMLCWPYFADQTINSRFFSDVWKLGLDIKDNCDRMIIEKMTDGVFEGHDCMNINSNFMCGEDCVEKVVIMCAGVCLGEKDLKMGLFLVTDVEEAAKILLPLLERLWGGALLANIQEMTEFNRLENLETGGDASDSDESGYGCDCEDGGGRVSRDLGGGETFCWLLVLL